MSAHARPKPVDAPFWTPGVLFLVFLMGTGFLFIIGRFTGGLGAVTNLSQTSPWGLWIGIDVATGVALAAGGFTTAALAHVFGRHRYEAVTRPTLLTAVLGYTFVSLGLVVDIGRSWAIWKPIFCWQPNSVLFEVAMCVVIYLNVLYIEFIPIAAERFRQFKPMRGKQMVDSENRYLIVPHLFGPGGYWKTLDWQKSFKQGMAAVGLPYSGKYDWVDTVMYWGLHHETMPAKNALGCAQCHSSLTGEKTCSRCHQDSRDVDFKSLATHGTDFSWMKSRGRDVSDLIGQTDFIDFRALGYKGDPIVYGGRFKRLPLGSATLKDSKMGKGNPVLE